MDPNRTLKHSDKEFVHSFNLAIGLRVVRRLAVVTQTQLRSQLCHHLMPKMGTMIGNDGLSDTKPSNNVIEYELGSCLTVGGKCRHFFSPFGEVVHDYDNISSRLRSIRQDII